MRVPKFCINTNYLLEKSDHRDSKALNNLKLHSVKLPGFSPGERTSIFRNKGEESPGKELLGFPPCPRHPPTPADRPSGDFRWLQGGRRLLSSWGRSPERQEGSGDHGGRVKVRTQRLKITRQLPPLAGQAHGVSEPLPCTSHSLPSDHMVHQQKKEAL